MSVNFSAEQYEQEFAAKRLQNYQVPKCKQSKAPSRPKGEITYIANEKGHLLPGVRRSGGNPFGDYIDTWSMPKTIPGPYNLNSMGRTINNLQKISEKKREAAQVIIEARENQKPVALRQSSSNRD